MVQKANMEIRNLARNSGVKLWEVAARLGINDGNFSRKLRFELPENKKSDKIFIQNNSNNIFYIQNTTVICCCQ